MKQITIFILVAFGLLSCQKNEDTSFATETAISAEEMMGQVNSFEEIDSSGILLFPLLLGNSQSKGESSLESSSGKKYRNSYYWNIIFYASETQQTYLLTDEKVLIQSYVKESKQDKIFYTIISDDYNKDQALTDNDPTYLYISDKKGQSFKQISPSGYHVVSWRFIKKSDKVMMMVQNDTDQNLQFDSKDEKKLFEYDLKSSQQPREAFSTEFKNQIRDLYERDWKESK